MAVSFLKTPLQKYTFYTKYARYVSKLQRRETYEEAIKRVCDMHRTRYPQALTYIDEAERAMLDGLAIGSQRALQFGGDPILKKNARIYNCSASACNRARFFQEAFWLLLCGCGVGFSVQNHHVMGLPRIKKPGPHQTTYVIDDTIEGWAEALGVLLSSYFADNQTHPQYAGMIVTFDYSRIRPEGSTISSGIGKAPGHKPLMRSLEKVRNVLDACIERGQDRLRPIDAYDIVMHVSDAVLSGGVRRSATICIFSPNDNDMIKAKTGNWYIGNPQRARSNNSALLLRDGTTYSEFMKILESVKEFGEPGFVWSDSTEVIFNPCVEVSLYPFDIETGEAGWQFCNLSEINVSACNDRETFERACRAAAIIGTLQAGYTTFEYLGSVSERITRREALLGVSLTGMMDNPGIALDGDLLETMAKYIIKVNEEVANVIGINPAARTTCIKPSGTASCMLGTASGIHPHHSRRYLRRVQANKYEPYVEAYRAAMPAAVEESVWNPNKSDVVLTFCVEAPQYAIVKSDLTAIKFLDIVKQTQQRWVLPGRVPERCVKPFLCHNVSNTVVVKNDEWDSVGKFIYENRKYFTGISLLPESGDVDYPQSPFTRVMTIDELISTFGYEPTIWACREAYEARINGESVWKRFKSNNSQHYIKLVDASMRFEIDEKRLYEAVALAEAFYTWNEVKNRQDCIMFDNVVEHINNTNVIDTEACAGGACDISASLMRRSENQTSSIEANTNNDRTWMLVCDQQVIA